MNLRLIFIGLATMLLLFACQNPMNQEGRGPDRDQDRMVEPTRFGDDASRTKQTDPMSRTRDGHTSRKKEDHNQYDVADEASDRITSEIDAIERAYVLTTNNNAYVAVVMDDDQRDDLNAKTKDKDQNKRDQTENFTQDSKKNKQGQSTMDRNRRGVADNDLEDRTFIGQDDQINTELKRDIAEIVRSVDSNIDNVYVSTNPDFVDLTNNYIDDIDAGHPIRGFFDEMGNMIERIFPQNR